jgi:hypothetical protein
VKQIRFANIFAMKRAHDGDGDEKRLRLDVEIPDIVLRVPPIAGLPRVMSIDDNGVETPVAKATPADVQNEANKRVYRANEWGKNVFKQADEAHNPFDDLPEHVKQVILSLGYARSEMIALAQFADLLADGQRLQLDYVPPLLPSEADERALRTGRLQGRLAALSKAAASLRRRATRMREAVGRDKAYYAEVRELRKTWTLHMAGGAKFTPVLSAVCAPQYGVGGADSSVPLSRSPRTGSITARVPLALRPRLCVSGSSAWATWCPTAEAEGLVQVHALLSDAQRSVRSTVLWGLLNSSLAEAQTLSCAAVRSEGSALIALLIVRSDVSETTHLTLGQPERSAVTLIEVFALHLLARLLHQYRLGIPPMFGQSTEFARLIPQRLLAWLLSLRLHDLFHRDASEALLRSNQSFVWGGTDLVDGRLISNAFVRGRSRVVLSLVDAVAYHVDGTTRSWGIEHVIECIQHTMQSK